MQGLLRIILVDSFIAGKRVVVDLDGHAALSGGNGAGKTTFLVLLPIFYGAEPRQVEPRAAGKDSFVDHYLRRSTSLIVYEYERGDGPCCAVLYRHPSSPTPKLAYRFLKAAFTTESFTRHRADGVLEFLRGPELRDRWSALGHHYSNQLDVVTDYRAVIQNDKGLLARTTDVSNKRRLARDFCLGDGSRHMQHIEKVCVAIQNQQGNLAKMKDMLADIMERDGLTIPEPRGHAEHQVLAERVHWFMDFEGHLDEVRSTLSDHDRFIETRSRVVSLYIGLGRAKEQLAAEIKDWEGLLAEAGRQRDERRSAWESEDSNFRTLISDHRDGVATLDKQIEGLHADRNRYDEDEADEKARAYDALDDHRARAQSALERYEQLESGVAHERKPFEAREVKERARYDAAIHRLRAEKDAASAQIAQLDDAFRVRRETIKDEWHRQTLEIQNASKGDRDALVQECADAKARAERPDRTPDERAMLAKLQHELDEANRLRDAALVDADAVRSSREQAKGSLDDALEKVRAAKRQVADRESELAVVRTALFPPDGSWLSRLREENPSWVDGIGRVVDPDLLLRTDLDPSFESAGFNFYGWDLTVSALEPVEAAREEGDLRERFSQADARYKEAKDAAEGAANEAETAARRHDEAKRSSEQAQQAVRRLSATRDEILGRQLSQREVIDQAVTERTLLAKKDIARLESRIKEFDQRLQDRQDALRIAHHEARNELQSQHAIDRSRLDTELEALAVRETEEKAHHAAVLKDIWADFDVLCSEKGIDPKRLSEARGAYQELSAQVSKVEGYGKLVRDYRAFLEHQWPRLSELNDELIAKKRQLADVEDKRAQAQARYKVDDEKLGQEIKRISGELNARRGLLSEASHLLDRGPRFPAVVEPAQGAPRYLIDQFSAQLEEYQRERDAIRKRVLSAETRLNRSGDEGIRDSWHRLCAEKESALGTSFSTDPEYWQHLPELIGKMVEEVVPTTREALIETLRTVSSQLADYFAGLQSADRRIAGYASRISSAIHEVLAIEALSDITLEMRSGVRDLGYWRELKHFAHAWSEWSAQASSRLPSSELVDALGDALAAVATVKTTRDLRNLFELTLKLTENGVERRIRNDHDLAHVSSHGLSYLALCAIYIGLTHYLCEGRSTPIHWPVDELGIIDPGNITRLIDMLDHGNIRMVAAFPDGRPELLGLFKRSHVIDRRKGIGVIDTSGNDLLDGGPPETKPSPSLEASRGQ